MANPPTARPFAQALGPFDEVEFYVYLYQGDPTDPQKPAPLLLMGEGVESYALALTPEAVAVGLEIVTVDSSARPGSKAVPPMLDGNRIVLWFRIADDMQALSGFATGVTVGVEVHLVTTDGRTKKRTFLVRIADQ